MDQALTTLRIAWRRRALFWQPMAVPLGLAALFTLIQPDFNATVIDLASRSLGAGSLPVVVVVRVLLLLPYLVLEAVAVGMVVALVAEGAVSARWLPNGPALVLAAVAAVVAAAVYALLIALAWGLQQWMGTLAPDVLVAREPMLRLMLFVVEDVDWGWAVATGHAIAVARRLFPGEPPHAPPPRFGRFVAAALLVLVASTATAVIQRTLLTQIFLVLSDAGAPQLIGQIADAAVSTAAVAITVPIIAMAIAVAAFAGRTATRA